MASDAIVPLKHPRKAIAKILGVQIGQEAQLSQVDAEDWGLLISHLSSGPQDSAVASQHESYVRLNLA
jgi:hypothetical protein